MLTDILQFLSPLAHPIDIIWLLCLLGVLLLLKKRQRIGAFLLAVIAILISVVGSELSARLLNDLERPWLRRGFEAIPASDAVVLLGGTHSTSQQDLMGLNLHEAGDRVLTAVELMRRKKAQTLVVGGGIVLVKGRAEPEGNSLKNWLEHWELFADPIIVLDGSRNTREEAEKVKALAEREHWKQIALVTSASHMKRAEAVFKHAGLKVIPVACDFTRSEPRPRSFDPFPKPAGFDHLDVYLHEQIGWWVYRWRGWIDDDAAKPAKSDGPQ